MSLEPSDLFSRFDLCSRANVLAAVSGGGDSLALLFLLKAFLDVHAPRTRLTAVTVDHRLRTGSAGEAETVGRLCELHGIAHRTVGWADDKPLTGVMAAARDARHRLLANAAIDAASDVVMTGHTLDDQAETVAMRRARRDEGDGLSGIARATLHGSAVWFCRPLLGVRRGALREWLSRRGIAWIDDPSNENAAYERVRVRSTLGNRDIEALGRLADQVGRKRTATANAAAVLVDEFVSCPAAGLFRVDPSLVSMEIGGPARYGVEAGSRPTPRREAVVLALRALLASVGGTSRLPDRGRVQALADQLSGMDLRATLSRALIEVRETGIWIMREKRDLPTLAIERDAIVWDGRWHVRAKGSAHGLVIAPIGSAAMAQADERDALLPQDLAQAAFSTEPGVFDDDGLVGCLGTSDVRGISASRLIAPHATYLPSFDVELAAALRRLFGLKPLPAAPWKDHIAAEA